jgi:uncharacterized protein YecT (DUF1311 family)
MDGGSGYWISCAQIDPDCDYAVGMQRINTTRICLVVTLCGIAQFVVAAKSQSAPCPTGVGPTISNVEMRECYTREQLRVNKEADWLASSIAAALRREAASPDAGKDSVDSPKELRAAASGLDASQLSWRAYRDQYCRAVMSSWTFGSGAGTAFEECLFKVGEERVDEMRRDFDAVK